MCLHCSACHVKLSVPDSARGKRVNCPRCGHSLPTEAPGPGPPRERAKFTPEGAPLPREGAWRLGLGIGGVLGLLAGAGLTVALAWPFGRLHTAPVFQAETPQTRKPKPVEPDNVPDEHPPFPREKFEPAPILPVFPEDMDPVMTVTSEPGAVSVLKPDRARVLDQSKSWWGLASLPGQRFVSVESRKKILSVWNSETAALEKSLPFPKSGGVKATSDGKWLLVTCLTETDQRYVLAWDLVHGRELWRSPTWESRAAYWVRVHLSPREDRVLVACTGLSDTPGQVTIFDIVTGRTLWQLDGDRTKNRIDNALWYPNGEQLLLARGRRGRPADRITVVDLETRQEVPYMNIKRSRLSAPLHAWKISPSGRHFFVRTGNEALLLDTATARVRWRTTIATFTHSGPAFSPDERWVACWGGGSRGGQAIGCFVHILDVRTGKEVYRLTAPSAFRLADFTRDGKGMITVNVGRLAVYTLPKSP